MATLYADPLLPYVARYLRRPGASLQGIARGMEKQFGGTSSRYMKELRELAPGFKLSLLLADRIALYLDLHPINVWGQAWDPDTTDEDLAPLPEPQPRTETHGDLGMYTNRGCRCEACKGANARYHRRYRAQQAKQLARTSQLQT